MLIYFLWILYHFLKAMCINFVFFSCWFILFLIWVAFNQSLYSSNLRFLSMTHFFVNFDFLSPSLLSLSHLIHLSLTQLHFCSFLLVMICLIFNFKYWLLLIFLLHDNLVLIPNSFFLFLSLGVYVSMFSQIFYGFTKNLIIYPLEKIFFKIIFCFFFLGLCSYQCMILTKLFD